MVTGNSALSVFSVFCIILFQYTVLLYSVYMVTSWRFFLSPSSTNVFQFWMFDPYPSPPPFPMPMLCNGIPTYDIGPSLYAACLLIVLKFLLPRKNGPMEYPGYEGVKLVTNWSSLSHVLSLGTLLGPRNPC